MNLIFLDIDGVLNCNEMQAGMLCGRIHHDKVMVLNGILQRTDARIVLSSAWRYIVHRGEAKLAGMEWLLRSHGVLPGRLVGVTGPDSIDRPATWSGRPEDWPDVDERGKQITAWLAEWHHDVERYVAIDDQDLGIRVASHPLVQTMGRVGLSAFDAQRAIASLRGVPVGRSDG